MSLSLLLTVISGVVTGTVGCFTHRPLLFPRLSAVLFVPPLPFLSTLFSLFSLRPFPFIPPSSLLCSSSSPPSPVLFSIQSIYCFFFISFTVYIAYFPLLMTGIMRYPTTKPRGSASATPGGLSFGCGGRVRCLASRFGLTWCIFSAWTGPMNTNWYNIPSSVFVSCLRLCVDLAGVSLFIV